MGEENKSTMQVDGNRVQVDTSLHDQMEAERGGRGGAGGCKNSGTSGLREGKGRGGETGRRLSAARPIPALSVALRWRGSRTREIRRPA